MRYSFVFFLLYIFYCNIVTHSYRIILWGVMTLHVTLDLDGARETLTITKPTIAQPYNVVEPTYALQTISHQLINHVGVMPLNTNAFAK